MSFEAILYERTIRNALQLFRIRNALDPTMTPLSGGVGGNDAIGLFPTEVTKEGCPTSAYKLTKHANCVMFLASRRAHLTYGSLSMGL